MYLLECNNVCKKFGKEKALRNFNLNISKGKIYGLFGNNGAGKSTVIRLINGLLTIDSGKIVFRGEKLGVKSKSRIAYLPENSYLDPEMKVNKILKYFNDFYSDFDLEKAYNLLKKFKIEDNTIISNMSKGTQRKFELILVISRKADLYIFDEPFNGVDDKSKDYFINEFISFKKDNSSIILTTHSINEISDIIDEIIVLDKGKIVMNSSKDKLNGKNLKKILKEILNDE